MYELEVDVLEIVLVLLLRKFVKILFFFYLTCWNYDYIK